MPDKSLPQLNQISDIQNTDLYHVVRNNIDYAITGANLKKAIAPYFEYSALISQIAPLTLTSGTFAGIEGANFTITTFVAGDDFSNMELISGTMNTTGAVIRATQTTPIDWSNGSTLDYAGEPFVVSKNANNDIAPLVNTFVNAITFTYVTTGTYKINIVHDSRKIQGIIGTSYSAVISRFILSNTQGDDGFDLLTFTTVGSAADDRLIFVPLKLYGYF